ncbi:MULTISPECIES: hypothetical protein [Pseudomonas]|uniref:Uncharacterized protein n=1 Tax=Pseudomonas gessardii TaxID=78544 RepID=A0A7Y1MR11_9PSED|nr:MULTISPECIES: hypothetical protein [Pseudomonas]MBH3422981.1 hypothetical protein [Pseudomonas gessardii]NNA67983.1 hypothetical protein [Pseudomonas gessardii]NNA96442.1 hypothetical protein [Pseudomonas gessardii]SDR42162.1 hypothetical protein SAMN04490207_6332 [Pseudomonas gessardii]
MSLTTTIFLLVLGWLTVASAMLWGVLRVTRRRHPPPKAATRAKARKPVAHHA